MEIRFDTGPDGVPSAFSAPIRIIEAQSPDDVDHAFAEMDRARAEGFWLAGYASYELGYALEARLLPLMPPERRLPLLRFGVYAKPQEAAALCDGPAELAPLQPVWDADTYTGAFDRVKEAIGAGDIYQANLTFPITTHVSGRSEALYAALAARQNVRHGALITQDGPTILSRSPELFFRTDADGRIETRPMKGTQPRDEDPIKDQARSDFLRDDVKNNAENLMIVDLLRNDISRVAEQGSVRVPKLFEIETYATVHQMVSTVEARLRPDITLSDIFRALYPCGSITGAPKIRAMEILRDLEPAPREIYCGTIGWAAPDGASCFNVAIRTILRDGDAAVLNVGGGVVWDSTAEAEYEEALWKARFARG